jgi:hypothetical protein
VAGGRPADPSGGPAAHQRGSASRPGGLEGEAAREAPRASHALPAGRRRSSRRRRAGDRRAGGQAMMWRGDAGRDATSYRRFACRWSLPTPWTGYGPPPRTGAACFRAI